MQSGDVPPERLYKIMRVAEKGGLVRSQQRTLQNCDRTVHRYWLIGYRSHIYRPLEAASSVVSGKMEWNAPSISGNGSTANYSAWQQGASAIALR